MKVEGMWCPSCAWVLEEVLKRSPGIAAVSVSFASDVIQGKYLPHVITLEEIARISEKLGYRRIIDQEEERKHKKESIIRLSLSAIVTTEVMMISMVLDGGFFTTFSTSDVRYLSLPLLLLTIPVVFWAGYPILKKGWYALVNRSPSMDTLVSVAALSAFFYSMVRLLQNNIHLYFDTAAMLVTFVLFGRYIETWLREKVLRNLRALHELGQQKVRLAGSNKQWVTPDALTLDSWFELTVGETLPVDAVIIEGKAMVDQAIITGEPRPVMKASGDELLSGSTLRSGTLILQKKRSAVDSFVGQILSLVEHAITSRMRQELLADALSRFFVPSVFALAIGTAIVLWVEGFSSQEVLMRVLTIMLVACPCSLGIAMPLVKVAVVGAARRQGIIVREPDAIERVRKLDMLLFDKTGTLTEGTFKLQQIVTVNAASEPETLALLAALERLSPHLIARELVRAAAEKKVPLLEAHDFESFEGMGVAGAVEGLKICIGNQRLMQEKSLHVPDELRLRADAAEKEGFTAVWYGWRAQAQGLLLFGDSVKSHARETIAWLKSRGIAVWIVSGDGAGTTQALSDQLGADHCAGEMLPAEKASLIVALQGAGHRIGMVGDGINDAPAIAQADVGFSIASTSDISREASDVTLLTTNPAALISFFDLSRRAWRALLQNMFFAFAYNACALPVAAAGMLNPLIALCAMFASSLTVTANALRVFTLKSAKLERGRKMHEGKLWLKHSRAFTGQS